MQLATVYQAQTINRIMYDQFYDYPVSSIMILGIAGGNGLNHIQPHIKKVYGVDINDEYLQACKTRYAHLGNTLETIQADVTKAATILPMAEMLIANLFVEYIGYPCFVKNIGKINPTYVSVVIQVNGKDSFISPSPYLDALSKLESVHHNITETDTTKTLMNIGYALIKTKEAALPNGKKLVRLDYKKEVYYENF